MLRVIFWAASARRRRDVVARSTARRSQPSRARCSLLCLLSLSRRWRLTMIRRLSVGARLIYDYSLLAILSAGCRFRFRAMLCARFMPARSHSAYYMLMRKMML